MQEDPNFHQYLRSEVPNTVSDAVLGDPVDAAQFVVQDDQLIQYANLSTATPLYAHVEERANSTVMKLLVSWSDEPAAEGSFAWSGDTLEWSIPTISRPQLNVSPGFYSRCMDINCFCRLGSCVRTAPGTSCSTSTWAPTTTKPLQGVQMKPSMHTPAHTPPRERCHSFVEFCLITVLLRAGTVQKPCYAWAYLDYMMEK